MYIHMDFKESHDPNEVLRPSERYTPGQVWSILTEGSEDPDEEIDVQVGLTHLPPAESTFIVRLGQGFTGEQAMSESGLHGNQTRLKQSILMRLTAIINEGES